MLFRASTFCLVVLLTSMCNGELYPGQPTPDFSVPTLSGTNFTNTDVPTGQRPPVMFYRYDERTLFLQTEWNTDSSVEDFVKYAPRTTHFVFFASQNSKENVERLHDRIVIASHGNMQLLDRCHFVPVPPESVTPWINKVFQQWKCIDHGCNSDFLQFTKMSEHGRKFFYLSMQLLYMNVLTAIFLVAWNNVTCSTGACISVMPAAH